MAAASKDQFANRAIVSVSESAANTLTFKKLETGISITEKVAWIISRIEYLIYLSSTVFNAGADYLDYGLSVSSAFTSPTFQEEAILDFNSMYRIDIGTAASGFFSELPLVKNFADLPGGGVIVPPAPLYLYARGVGLASATTVVARLFYVTKTMSTDEVWELVEARRVISS